MIKTDLTQLVGLNLKFKKKNFYKHICGLHTAHQVPGDASHK